MNSPFEGELVRLRAREPEDEPLTYDYFNDPDVTRHLTLRYPNSHARQRAFIEENGRPSYGNAGFAIVVKADGHLIGGCDLFDANAENRSAELGIAIGDKAYWDGGYGTDTMRTLCRFGFEMMNLNRIELLVYADNERARHVYEKVGFVLEAVKRDYVYKFGRYQDAYLMGLLAGELR